MTRREEILAQLAGLEWWPGDTPLPKKFTDHIDALRNELAAIDAQGGDPNSP